METLLSFAVLNTVVSPSSDLEWMAVRARGFIAMTFIPLGPDRGLRCHVRPSLAETSRSVGVPLG